MAFLKFFIPFSRLRPNLLVESPCCRSFFSVVYERLVRSRVKATSMAPTLREIDMELSLKMMIMFRSSPPI